MSKKIIFILFVSLILIIVFCIKFLSSGSIKNTQVACTADAKICPDGSSVGRSGPNCEFTACP